MEQLPVFLDVRDRNILITGGGTVAARRTEMSLRAGANVAVYAQSLCDDFDEFSASSRFTHHARPAKDADLDGCLLVYGASEDEAHNADLAKAARARKILVNVADVTEYCDFITPSIVDRDPLVVAISSSGFAPILARIIRTRLETMLPGAFGTLAGFAGSFRDQVMDRLKDTRTRRYFWERIIDGPVADRVMAGDEKKARQMLLADLEATATGKTGHRSGEVYLVGAGPGDPDLLTFRALRLMQRADVVLYDRLIGDGVLNLVRRDADRIYVGKMAKNHELPQDDISQLLVKLARQGKRVLRLKGGDPFIFGRGGEEIETLAENSIPFQVVPGITSASGASAYAGIPLTHRDHAQACVFITAHGKDGVLNLDWDVLMRPGQTVAVYMGLRAIPLLTAEFIKRGADPHLPAAVIDNATRKNQRVITATIATLAEAVEKAGFEGPAMMIFGTVVTLHDKLAWYART